MKGKDGMIKPERGDIYWVRLDPTVGSEIKKKRPAVIISNDTANQVSPLVIAAPVTSKASRVYPFEVSINLNGTKGKVLLDQLRSIDKLRIGAKLGSVNEQTLDQIDEALRIALGLPQ